MHEISRREFPPDFTGLIQPFSDHLAIEGIMLGDVEARVFVDDPTQPQSGLICRPPRYFLAGSPSRPGLPDEIAGLVRSFDTQSELYLLFYSPQSWENLLEGSFKGLFPINRVHSNYSIQLEERLYFNGGLPEGIEFVQVDHGLLSGNLKYVDDMKDEMCSERASVEDFLQKSFGLVPIHDSKIIGWCLSEYNTTEACEIGIAIRPEYQRQGLATAITLAFLDLARQRGLQRVGWNCWKDNIPSAKTAVKAGFRLVRDHPVLFGFFDPTIQLGVHGNQAFDLEHYPVALSWYEKGIQRGDAPGWLIWNAIRAAAWTGKGDRALELIELGLVQGKLDEEKVTSSKDLVSLHNHPDWRYSV